MAAKEIKKQKVNLNEGLNITFEAPDSAEDGFALDYSAQDERTVVLFTGSGEETVIIKKGDGIQGVADLDKVTLEAEKTTIFRLDSGAFKNVTGENKGKVLAIPSAETVKAAVIVLP